MHDHEPVVAVTPLAGIQPAGRLAVLAELGHRRQRNNGVLPRQALGDDIDERPAIFTDDLAVTVSARPRRNSELVAVTSRASLVCGEADTVGCDDSIFVSETGLHPRLLHFDLRQVLLGDAEKLGALPLDLVLGCPVAREEVSASLDDLVPAAPAASRRNREGRAERAAHETLDADHDLGGPEQPDRTFGSAVVFCQSKPLASSLHAISPSVSAINSVPLVFLLAPEVDFARVRLEPPDDVDAAVARGEDWAASTKPERITVPVELVDWIGEEHAEIVSGYLRRLRALLRPERASWLP